ncbi:MAG: FAD-dependent oxidoreductase, partial [Pseudomonadota bacterium]
IAGLSAAWLLSTRHEVTLFEKSAHLGMDSHSLDIETSAGTVRIDVPLRVFFDGFYPNLSKLYRHLSIEFEPINYSASFGLLDESTYFRFDNYRVGRYAVPFPKGRRSLGRKALRIGLDNLRFFRQIDRLLKAGIADEVTLEAFIGQHNYSSAFADGYLYPAFAGICTCSTDSVKAYPARVILEYLNSGLLLSSVQRVTLGTQDVVQRLVNDVHDVQLATQVVAVTATDDGVDVETNHASQRFDHVVMASQANQSAALLSETACDEHRILEKFRYEPSQVIVHNDANLAPKGGPTNWAPVNFLMSETTPTPMATIWLNSIQSLPESQTIFQTWNPIIEPEPGRVFGMAEFERPVVTETTLRALQDLNSLHEQPGRRIWLCGSYASHGIPLLESAVTSAFSVSKKLGCSLPW